MEWQVEGNGSFLGEKARFDTESKRFGSTLNDFSGRKSCSAGQLVAVGDKNGDGVVADASVPWG